MTHGIYDYSLLVAVSEPNPTPSPPHRGPRAERTKRVGVPLFWQRAFDGSWPKLNALFQIFIVSKCITMNFGSLFVL